jgi:tRNA(Ile2) C34 agmatinyltransferase TiaS
MEPLLNPKKISLTIEVKNFIGIKQKNVNLKLIRIDDYLYYKPKEYESKTDEEGIANFNSILEGAYLVQILKNKILVEKILEVRKNDTIEIRLPIMFGLFKKEQKVSDEEVNKIYEKYRIDTYVCFKCKNKYKSWTDKFLCKYCKKYFCSKHRLPEEHNCWGEPKALPSGYNVIFSSGQTIVSGK